MRERDIYRMHSFWSEDVNGTRERRRRRRHEDSESAVVEFFDNERRYESFFNFSQRRLPNLILRTAGELLSQTPEKSVARNSFEKRSLDSRPRRASCRRPYSGADEETNSQDEKERESLFGGKPL